MPPNAQLPPTELLASARKQKSPEEIAIEGEKVALARQRQYRLDQQQKEANIKFALGTVGTFGLAAFGAYKFKQQMELNNKKYDLALQTLQNQMQYQQETLSQRNAAAAITQYATDKKITTALINSGTNIITSTAGLTGTILKSGASLANTGINASTQMISTVAKYPQVAGQLAPYLAGGAVLATAGAAGLMASLMGPQAASSAGQFMGEKFAEGGINFAGGLLTGVAKGTAKGIYNAPGINIITGGTEQLLTTIYNIYKENTKPPTPILPYDEFIKTLSTAYLRGHRPGEWGLQPPPVEVLGDFVKNVTNDLTETFDNAKNYVSIQKPVPVPEPTFEQRFDVDKLWTMYLKKWPQKVWDNLETAPDWLIKHAYKRSKLKYRPQKTALGMALGITRYQLNLQKLYDLYHEKM
jgi:hypothetical protein